MTFAKRGDTGALDALLRRHHLRLLTLCARLTGNPTDADDACQEALVALARGLDGFDGRSSFSTWAYRVTTNTCLDELRRRRRRPVPGLPEDAPTHPGGSEGGPDDPGEMVTRRVDIDSALGRLAPEFRQAVVLRDLCQLSYAEIADIVDVPVGTVRSRIARGRALLLPLLSAGGTPLGHGAGASSGNPTASSERPRR
ncbi:MAG: RNA polymerase sigma factor [Actinomycetota bacterium]|nr:RNA polymerase sigma factor [Actinomycetota bacterium]